MRGFSRLVLAQATLLRRNVAYWVPTLGLAIISMLVFGWLFDIEAQPFSLGLVDEDGSAASQGLIRAFDGLDNVEVKEGPRQRELAALEDGKRAAVLVIPAGFGAELTQGRAVLPGYYDNSNPIRLSYAASTIDAVVEAYNTTVAGASNPVIVERQDVETKNVSQIEFLTPGMAGLTLLWGALFGGIVFLAGWREMGILRRLGVTPLRPAALIASQGASLALLSFVQVAIIFLIGRLVFGVTVEGSYLLLGGTLVLGVACMLALGYIIGSFLNTLTAASAVANLVTFPMMFLGGSWFPSDSAPDFLQPVVRAIPLTHLNDALREVVNKGGGLGDIWLDWAILAAWAAAGFLVSLRVFRWQ
ncbi:MAG: ABC transporter permease [Chloroflexota bacterium]|nr:ABC transporter permease [Chloroflexota bacterium]